MHSVTAQIGAESKTGLSWRNAKPTEAIEILKADGVIGRFIDLGLAQHIEGYVNSLENGTIIIVNNRLIAILEPNAKGVEFHPASAKKNWKHIRSDIKDLKLVLVQMGYQTLYLSIADRYKTSQNLAIKCGFESYDRIGDEVKYKWQYLNP